jgi:hypothetical protein
VVRRGRGDGDPHAAQAHAPALPGGVEGNQRGRRQSGTSSRFDEKSFGSNLLAKLNQSQIGFFVFFVFWGILNPMYKFLIHSVTFYEHIFICYLKIGTFSSNIIISIFVGGRGES